jgi:hypothetical protein
MYSVICTNDCGMQPLTWHLARRNVRAVVGGGRTYGADRSIALLFNQHDSNRRRTGLPPAVFWLDASCRFGASQLSAAKRATAHHFSIRRTRHSTGTLPGEKCESSPDNQSPLTKGHLWQALWMSNALLHRSVVIKPGGRPIRLRDHHAASETVRRTSSGIRRPMQIEPAIRVGTLNEQLSAIKRGRSGGDRISPSSTVVT